MTTPPAFGAFVISLDFELHWGVRDTAAPDGPYRNNLLGARKAVPAMLALFRQFDIAATWATVGFLFARNERELRDYSPQLRPTYRNGALDPYKEPLGPDEAHDPLHYAPSLIERIRECPRQEMATHTFSHYYCMEEGQTPEMFRADMKAAVAIAADRGFTLRSIVLPRNQYLPAYGQVLRDCGITIYRGTERHWMYQTGATSSQRTPWRRAARITDNYVDLSGPNATPWSAIQQPDGMWNVPSSRILRPYSQRLARLEPLRLRRIANAMTYAAAHQQIFHLDWHPHNFGVNLEENLAFLRQLLSHYRSLRERYGMQSLSMAEVADRAAGKRTEPAPPRMRAVDAVP
ncbi:MAG: polysaccharide deacetylase family protein [Bryobacterales bacterium]|nr:polysaccharide deacetylase family protein [Bryobacterales bacterium]